jgi:hypothetical protein
MTVEQNNFPGFGCVRTALVIGIASIVACSSGQVPGPLADEPKGDAAVATFESRSELPTCNPSRRGAVYYVTSEQVLYYCDGSSYRQLDAVGEPGPEGPPGADGADGEDGADGMDGADGEDGVATLVETREATVHECANGGVVLLIGADRNADGMLDPDEIATERPVCNGTPGADGADGEDGQDGKNSLIETSPAASSDCPAGGTIVRAGVDDDADGVLDPEEVDATEKVCNGISGEGPACPALRADCNADPNDGCETNLNESVNNCGACGSVCGAAPNASRTCASGQCDVAACDHGFGNCDTDSGNGCEVDLAVSAGCEAAVDLGSLHGDTECMGFPGTCFDADREARIVRSGRSSAWFTVEMTGFVNSCNGHKHHELTLASAPDSNFDLFVYSACGELSAFSTNEGAVDHLELRSPRGSGDWQVFPYWVEVRYVSGSSCDNWNLTIQGFDCEFGG